MASLSVEPFSAIMVSPHLVQLVVPERGFGTELDVMVQFCLEHGEEFRIGCIREIDQRNCILFCFRDWKNAAEFAKRFRGELRAVSSGDDLSFP